MLWVRPCAGEDSEQTRYYLGVRFGEFIPGTTKAHDVAGVTLGANLGRYLGVELAVDSYELKVQRLAEMSVLGLIPQLRLRYPLLHNALVPYFLAGAGLAVTQGNDGRSPVSWSGGKNGVQGMGAVGGGLEYFIADNIALGVEGKYLISGDVDYTADGQYEQLDVSAGLLTLGFRLLYPELHPAEAAAAAASATARFYFDLRTGGALLVDDTPFPGVAATPEQPVLGGNFSVMFGASAGVDIGRYAGLEMSIENYELRLDIPRFGTIGEYAVFPITVRPRLRYPLLNGRVETHVLGGVGAEFAELNDRSVRGQALDVEAKDLTVVGTFGAGIEYALMNNVRIGGAATYVISRGHTLQIEGGSERNGNFDSLLLSIGVRIIPFSL